LSPETARAATEWEVEIRPGVTVLVRRASMATLLFSGQIPLPLTQALARLDPEITGQDLLSWDVEEREALLEALRLLACAVVVDPVVVREPDGDPAHLPVSYFTLEELFAILNAEPPSVPSSVPRLTEDDAARFRDAAPAADPPALPPGAPVPPAPVLVDSADVDLLHA
jgi:hypothetical protein